VSVVTPLSVCWDGDAGGSRLAEPCGLALLGVREQAAREAARLRIRAVLTTVLAAHFGLDAGRITLHSPEGVPMASEMPRLRMPGANTGPA
jgi:hypothetical protein